MPVTAKHKIRMYTVEASNLYDNITPTELPGEWAMDSIITNDTARPDI